MIVLFWILNMMSVYPYLCIWPSPKNSKLYPIHFLLFWLWRQKGCGIVMFWWLPYFTLYCHCKVASQQAYLMKIFIKMIFLLGYYIHCIVWCNWYHGDKLDILLLLAVWQCFCFKLQNQLQNHCKKCWHVLVSNKLI